MDEIIRRVISEVASADVRYGDYHSTHEALGVLIEEVAELTDAIRANCLKDTEREAIQVAAVSMRLAAACAAASLAFTERSGIK